MRNAFSTIAFAVLFVCCSCDIISPRIPAQKIEYGVTFSGMNTMTDTSRTTTMASNTSVEVSAVLPNEASYLATFGAIDGTSAKGITLAINRGESFSLILREANTGETLSSGKQYKFPSTASSALLASFKVRVNIPNLGTADVLVNGTSPEFSGILSITEYTAPTNGKAGRITGTLAGILTKPSVTLVPSGQQQVSTRDVNVTASFNCAMKAL